VVRDRDGNVYDVADKVVKWLVGAERWFDKADAEAGERSNMPMTSYEGVMDSSHTRPDRDRQPRKQPLRAVSRYSARPATPAQKPAK
jgi:hypothetical protein